MSQSESNKAVQVSNLYDVKDRVCVVTGGGSGIGLMCTQALAANGAKVYIVGRSQDKLDNVVKSHGQNISGQIIPVTADITKKEDIQRLVTEIESKEKCVCVVINNAGIDAGKVTEKAKTAEEMKKNLFDDADSNFESWTDIYRTNVPPLFFVSAAFLPLLAKATEHHHGYSGTIINISSISGLVKASQSHFDYNSSKAAAIHLTRMLAIEIAENDLKIRVNSIAPGVFPSEMTTEESDSTQKSQIEKDKYAKVPAHRPGKEEDMAQAVLFLVCCQYLNGVTVPVDGGYTIMAGL